VTFIFKIIDLLGNSPVSNEGCQTSVIDVFEYQNSSRINFYKYIILSTVLRTVGEMSRHILLLNTMVSFGVFGDFFTR
jgi:hypothetical protein